MTMAIDRCAGRMLACAVLLAVAGCASGGGVEPSGAPVATSAGAGLGGVGGTVTPATTQAQTGAANAQLGAGAAGR